MWDLNTIVRMNAERAEGKPASVPGLQPEDKRERCPECGSYLWDNRPTKRNPRAPDFKCQNRECDYVVWPDAFRRPLGAVRR